MRTEVGALKTSSSLFTLMSARSTPQSVRLCMGERTWGAGAVSTDGCIARMVGAGEVLIPITSAANKALVNRGSPIRGPVMPVTDISRVRNPAKSGRNLKDFLKIDLQAGSRHQTRKRLVCFQVPEKKRRPCSQAALQDGPGHPSRVCRNQFHSRQSPR